LSHRLSLLEVFQSRSGLIRVREQQPHRFLHSGQISLHLGAVGIGSENLFADRDSLAINLERSVRLIELRE